MDKLMSAPLTMEDKGQFINLPLLGTLRPGHGRKVIQDVSKVGA